MAHLAVEHRKTPERLARTTLSHTYLLLDQLCDGVASHYLLILRIIPYLLHEDRHNLTLHLQITSENVHSVEKDVAKLVWVSLAQ